MHHYYKYLYTFLSQQHKNRVTLKAIVRGRQEAAASAAGVRAQVDELEFTLALVALCDGNPTGVSSHSWPA